MIILFSFVIFVVFIAIFSLICANILSKDVSDVNDIIDFHSKDNLMFGFYDPTSVSSNSAEFNSLKQEIDKLQSVYENTSEPEEIDYLNKEIKKINKVLYDKMDLRRKNSKHIKASKVKSPKKD